MASKRWLQFSSSGNIKKSKTTPTSTPEPELSPGNISSLENNATVRGIVTSLSPARQTDRICFGELSDSDTIIPLVGFDKTHRQFLYTRMDTETLVTLRNCQINTKHTTGKLQIVVKSHTILEESHDKNLTIPDRNTIGSPAVIIAELSTLGEYDRATLQVTAQKVKDPVTVSNGKQKQDIIVADSTGHTTLTLWEEDIGMIVENKSCQLNRIQIHHYLGKTELNFPLFGASAEEIDDLLEVSMLHNNDDTTDFHSVTIIAVTKLETTFTSINCRKKLALRPKQHHYSLPTLWN